MARGCRRNVWYKYDGLTKPWKAEAILYAIDYINDMYREFGVCEVTENDPEVQTFLEDHVFMIYRDPNTEQEIFMAKEWDDDYEPGEDE